MEKSTTDIDRKLAIYYHPLFQETMHLLINLFSNSETIDEKKYSQLYPNKISDQLKHPNNANLQSENKKNSKNTNLQIGLIEFIEFNLKLQKCLLPTFQVENALVSALNDWVKEVAECLSYDGMVKTIDCQQITEANFESLLRKQIINCNVQLFQNVQKYLKTLAKLKSHDAFKLLGVKVNKQVFSKFMFDLCSTWCQFLDIEMFVYFLMSIFLQMSEGVEIENSRFRATHLIQAIDIEFMERFQELKQSYSKSKKKELRYYRAWCEWNYLRVGEVGEGLIVSLDNILDDTRVLEIALVFQKAIKVINQQITSQSYFQSPPQTVPLPQNDQKQFLIMKKLDPKQKQKSQSITASKGNTIENNNLDSKQFKKSQQQSYADMEQSLKLEEKYYNDISPMEYEDDDFHQNFEIQIDQLGNMFLKRVVKLPILGEKIQMQEFKKKNEDKIKWLQAKKQDCRKVSNLYRRLENMKVRLQHSVKQDYYFYKKNARVVQRDQFYQKQAQQYQKKQKSKPQTSNKVPIFQKSIHEKLKPQQSDSQMRNLQLAKHSDTKYYTAKNKEPIRKSEDYIHKVIAPSFLTDNKHNISYLQRKQGSIYGTGAQDQRRDIKYNLPKIKFMRDHKVKDSKSYHIVGKLTKDRSAINERVKAISISQEQTTIQRLPLGIETQSQKIIKFKNQNEHLINRYINQQEAAELTNYQDLYKKIQGFKKNFSQEFISEYRNNLKPILVYENKRYEMGGVIEKKDEERFYQKMKKLINRDQRRKKRKAKKQRFRQYKKTFKNKGERMLYEDIFIKYHKEEIRQIKEQRSRVMSTAL